VTKARIVITAGPTYEPIDPVRGITNLSTGLMGYELARAAVKKGHKVTLISGPTWLVPPERARVLKVTTAGEMAKAVRSAVKSADCLIMAAAVADFRVKTARDKKIKRSGPVSLDLVKNIDILRSVKGVKLKVKVGFALETDNCLKNARKKLEAKGLDMIVMNRAGRGHAPFGDGKKEFVLIPRDGRPERLRDMTKNRAASAIIDAVEEYLT
jgi:phosphopantothenoylcysteine decarboxylase/phosphopantothenate--cysteine ligase